uniref:Late embryogenesis abundant protein LEA-2 subgroup domain-containing protein n=1 Tax=Aegilops tauschii TaxID=37682 RepID=M8BF17_AEGTA
MDFDLEQAAYHAIPSDPRGGGDDDEAPVLGNAPAARFSDKERLCLLLIFSVPLVALMLFPMYYMEQANVVSFSVGLAGYEGIDPARPGRVVSPAFNLTLRMNKTCADRAEVVLTYSGVALGWARVEPRACVSREPWGRGVEVVARADGVGLSGPLRERMASEWRRSGRVELDVDVAVYWETGEGRRWGYLGGNTRDKVMRCKVAADGRPSESPPCPWYSLRPYSYDRFSAKS